ncbi:DUF4837 family protein [Flavobacterium sp. TAB 87]|uniref:DUF4837 family protein n=1 Tax=Flavobacterium sp. TAB 87 TaxID=1729581 RepID=UPI00076CC74D|nr:DUF4837 family protein [Flavobacterium sp. TAB 87]KVV13507.1 hypothetical protein AP058_02872 [Flavobacterium sp. TAB 87]
MNKAIFFILISAVLCISCFKKNDKNKSKEANKTNAISVIIDDQLWYGEVGDTIRNKFASPVVGLTKEEPLFTINQYSAKLLEGYMTDGRNVIIVKKEDFNKFEVKRNQYTSPQNVFRISGKSIADIIQSIEINAASIIQQIHKTELEECQQQNAKSLLDPTVIKNKFHIDLKIPTGFKYALHERNFIWLKKEVVGGNISLLLYQIPLHSFDPSKDIANQIVKIRDSVGLHVKGKEPDTPMVTDDSYAPYFSTILLDGKKAFETKGTWELQNDFMMGPFINYAIIDETYNRVLVVEGFCYAPSNEERDLMLYLESIIKSVQVQPRQKAEE